MSDKNKPLKKKPLRRVFIFYVFLAIIPLFLEVTIISVFGGLYQVERNIVFIILMGSFILLFAVGFVFWLIYLVKKLRAIFVDGLYSISLENYRRINAGGANVQYYPHPEINEFGALNTEISHIRSTFENSTLIFGSLDYSKFDLEPAPGFPNAVDYASFTNALVGIIGAAGSFRNAIIEIYFDLNDKPIENEDIAKILDVLDSYFASYRDHLLIVPANHKSIFLFLPRIDSFTAIKERLDATVSKIAVGKVTTSGFTPVPMQYSIVCYPFSSYRELLPDLEYAKRQNKLANLYLPNRHHRLEDASIGKNTMYLNQMSRTLFNISSIISDPTNKQDVREAVGHCLASLNTEMHFAMAGIIAYDADTDSFMVKDHVGPENIFKVGDRVDASLISAVRDSIDANGAFFFSCRDHVSNALARFADRVSITSGYFYLFYREGKPHGFFYFLNQEGSANLDSYCQEALNAACYQIASSYAMGEIIEDIVEAHRQFDALLTNNDSMVYRVDSRNHELSYLSKGLLTFFPKAKAGDICYKAFYGLNGPCKDCPLATGSKKRIQNGKFTFDVSMALDVHRGATSTLLISHIDPENTGIDLYDRQLLIYSFPILRRQLAAQYEAGNNGYTLLLRIDNFSELLDRFGSEGILAILRSFCEGLKRIGHDRENIYRFDEQTLAVVLPVAGQVDLINVCEDIYRITKGLVYEGEDTYNLDITYLSMNFPQGYATSTDFIRHMFRDHTSRKYDFHKDLIYFDDSDYVRQASRKDFMLSVIDEQFGNETFHINLQPIVRADNKKIFAAELLLRITDEVRHIVFNPGELVKVATENGKISLISQSLLRYVANFYSSIGEGALKSYGFSRMSINTDVSFFTDPTFEESFNAFREQAQLPNGFVAFEIAERDIYDHMQDFRDALKILQRLHIVLIIDQYSGRYIRLEEVKELGFKQIKIGRNMVHGIDSDQSKLKDIKMLLESAKQNNMSAAVVGVENIDQYNILLGIDPKMEMQGYYFYAPLERAALLDALRQR